MESTPSSTQNDPLSAVDVAPMETKDRLAGVEDALARLASRGPRDAPEPRTRTEGSDVSAGQAAEPPLLAIASTVCFGPQAAEASVPTTASTVSAGPQAPEPPPTTANPTAVPPVAGPSVRATAPDVSVGAQAGGPSVLAAVRPAEFRQGPFPNEKPSLGRRAARAVIRFVVAVCVGVAGSLAWQSYGGAAREMIASRVPQLAWIASPAVTSPTSGPAPTTGQTDPSPASEAAAPPQAAPVGQAATDAPQTAAAPPVAVAQTTPEQTTASVAAPAAPSADRQQLEAMARDIGALRQSVEQIAARQEQMTRDMAKLQATETSRHRTSAPPHLAATPPRRPPMPQVSSAAPPALPAPQMSPERPQSAVAPQPLRPPMPVMGQP